MSNLRRGFKFFELSNHLGNVLVTVSDKRIGHSTDGTTIDYWNADVVNANDYAPFGMQMVGKTISAGSGYRYGFNGKEKDDEVKGDGDQYDYGMRIYDPRLGRFLSTDPLASQFPFYTPYQFAGNKPIWAIDLDGAEELILPRGGLWNLPKLQLPRIPIPIQPSPPIPPAIPQGFSMPQTPTLPPAPYIPVPPIPTPITRTTPLDESAINPNDATTYPAPPFGEGWKVTPIKPGTKGYEKLKEKGATRLENEKGDVLRWHSQDKYHPKGHWDYKSGGNPNKPWENFTPDGTKIPEGQIYGKDFNPALLLFTDPSTFPATEYPAYLNKQYQQYKQQQIDYQKKKSEYDKKIKEYENKSKEYEEKKQQYYKSHPEIIA